VSTSDKSIRQSDYPTGGTSAAGDAAQSNTMEVGIHLPQLDFAGEGLTLSRVTRAVDAARENGFAAISVNDHIVYKRPWLDGLTVLAAVIERSGQMDLATSIALPTLRGPAPLAKALAALDVLSDGRVIAGLGAGSSPADYAAMGIPFEQRWPRFDEAVAVLKGLLRGEVVPAAEGFYPRPAEPLLPMSPRGGVPLWLGSWGSAAGLRRVARLGDGWLASAYNTDPETFGVALARLGGTVPHALVTMWTWITDREEDAERMRADVLAPFLGREPAQLRDRLCVGSASMCAELLSRYARAGCRRVHFWPLGDESRQLDLLANEVLPRVEKA
jgi:alkanesulfonate monooxygenase SsuD/methylene tetrahydromethanopterin reductase-like flavin-dependent oxidoreductase (luciferase family)